jgi:uncharacterized protein
MTDKSQNVGPDADSAPLCVICRVRSQTEKYRPFCSKRCSDVDLHRWLDGVYAIPGKLEEEEDETPGER